MPTCGRRVPAEKFSKLPETPGRNCPGAAWASLSIKVNDGEKRFQDLKTLSAPEEMLDRVAPFHPMTGIVLHKTVKSAIAL
jgi:hypothetical protein